MHINNAYGSVSDYKILYVDISFKTELEIDKYMVCVLILEHRMVLSQLSS